MTVSFLTASADNQGSLANQEVLRWQMNMQKEIGTNITHDNIKDFLWKTLKSGQVVPGYVYFDSVLVCHSISFSDNDLDTATVCSVTLIPDSLLSKSSAIRVLSSSQTLLSSSSRRYVQEDYQHYDMS